MGWWPENAYDLRPEYSSARLDRRHQVSGGAVLVLPHGIGRAVTFQFRSGLPIDARFGSDVNDDRSNGADRPFRASGVPFERHLFRNRSTSTVDLHLSKSVATMKSGSLTVSVDLFNLFNASNIQYAGSEVTNCSCSSPVPATCGFDAPTNPNFLQVVDRDPASGAFGQHLLTNTPGDPRQVQIGVRLSLSEKGSGRFYGLRKKRPDPFFSLLRIRIWPDSDRPEKRHPQCLSFEQRQLRGWI